MHVRKFEADTLEEALREVKGELGPDAIILKTATHKGLKGAFKRKRVEITAAISEKNYVRKAKVDRALGDENKDSFYKNNSSYIANMINEYSDNKEADTQMSNNGYGNVGLNKSVNTTKAPVQEQIQSKGSGLDDFLSQQETSSNEASPMDKFLETSQNDPIISESVSKAPPRQVEAVNNVNFQSERVIQEQQIKIDKLERKLFDLSETFKNFEKPESQGIKSLRHSLRSLDVSDDYIKEVIKKCSFELSETEMDDADTVFEFALRDMTSQVKTEMPLFSSTDLEKDSVITVFISETSCGQTTLAKKIAALTENAKVIQLQTSKDATVEKSFSEKILGIDVVRVRSIAECVSQVKKCKAEGQNVFIDYKGSDGQIEETKKFIDGLRRSFDNMEVLVALSGIHSELYNKKVINRYQNLANGLVVSNLDMCLNYGALFNIGFCFKNLPYKFFGNGAVIPDDIEAATIERLLAGVFNL